MESSTKNKTHPEGGTMISYFIDILRRWLVLAITLGSVFLIQWPSIAGPLVQQNLKHDVSVLPLGSMLLSAQYVGRSSEHSVVIIRPPERRPGLHLLDNAVQMNATRTLSVNIETPYDGIQANGKADPSDSNVAVGIADYVEWVNQLLAVYDKSNGKLLYGPVEGSRVWSGFGGNCEKYNDGDPIAQYDKMANRWLLSQFVFTPGKPYSQCIAVSTGSDPLGTYARYEFQFDDLNDYPKFGVWPDGYYASFNMSGDDGYSAYACAFQRDKMLAGLSAEMQCFVLPEKYGLLPSDLDGVQMPPTGAPNYFVNIGDYAEDSTLNVWKFHVDWVDPSMSSFAGPQVISVSPYVRACDYDLPVNCSCSLVEQPATTNKLQTLGDRLMYRLAYRRFSDHESLVVNHTVLTNGKSSIRWYEIRGLQATPTIWQQGTYAPDNFNRWIGSMAMDKVGDTLLGYSVGGSSLSPSFRFTGRVANDPLGTMAAEQKLIDGTASEVGDDRWGDYTSVSVDPVDDCTFWFTSQYLTQKGAGNWHTAVARVRFHNCH
jgi:hypothetical protein